MLIARSRNNTDVAPMQAALASRRGVGRAAQTAATAPRCRSSRSNGTTLLLEGGADSSNGTTLLLARRIWGRTGCMKRRPHAAFVSGHAGLLKRAAQVMLIPSWPHVIHFIAIFSSNPPSRPREFGHRRWAKHPACAVYYGK
jgi:hypothetical protein